MISFIKRYGGFFLLLGGIIGLVIINIGKVSASGITTSSTLTTLTEKTSDGYVFVEIKGAVISPGVYRMPEGSRINDVIHAANGTKAEAILDQINCSQVIWDEQVIVIPQAKDSPEEEELPSICVDVKGEVFFPGVYCLVEGSRIQDALVMAGGVREEGDDSSINKAVVLKDEMVIWIPSLEDSENANQGSDGLGYFYVEIRGEVIKTGLYYVPSTTKIKDIINLAGGLTLAGSVLNLDVEELVQSGMKITVLTLEEALSAIEEEQDSEEEPDGSKININTATKEQLESLIGIGAVLAQAIIDHRAENGDFETIEDIMLVTGIKQSVYEEIKDDICV